MAGGKGEVLSLARLLILVLFPSAIRSAQGILKVPPLPSLVHSG